MKLSISYTLKILPYTPQPELYGAQNREVTVPVYRTGNVITSYIHLLGKEKTVRSFSTIYATQAPPGMQIPHTAIRSTVTKVTD